MKKILILIVSLSIAMTACTKQLPGGHSISVNMPSNGCGVSACTTAPANTPILDVK